MRKDGEVLLDISNSSNLEVLVVLFYLCEFLAWLYSTTYHRLNASSLALLYSAEGN